MNCINKVDILLHLVSQLLLTGWHQNHEKGLESQELDSLNKSIWNILDNLHSSSHLDVYN